MKNERTVLRCRPFLFSFCILHSALILTAAPPPREIVLISGEFEYQSKATLPPFKESLEKHHGFHCTYLERTEGDDIPGLAALDKADLAIVFIRRMTLPEEQLSRFRKFVDSGKPLIALRTSSHAFENWKEFDRDVLGGNYHNHHGNDIPAAVRANPAAANHPILKNVPPEFSTPASLYKNAPISTNATILLYGSIPDQPAEPVAWTHQYKGRVFYTSLGHPKDFENPPFRQLLVNAIYWALNEPQPGTDVADAGTKAGPRRVGVDEFEQLWRDKQNVVLDVRTKKEFDAGHIPGAINLDVNAADFQQQTARLNTNKVYLVHCAAGVRSARACDKMSQMGFGHLVDLAPGFRGWEKAGKPTETTK
jgi:rhodanese-related sulfurtransferase/type 1 glutamine amidotransferase